MTKNFGKSQGVAQISGNACGAKISESKNAIPANISTEEKRRIFCENAKKQLTSLSDAKTGKCY